MEKEKKVLESIKSRVTIRVNQLLVSDGKTLPDSFRLVNEAIQEYCTFRTLLDKYLDEETDKKSE